MGAKLIYMGVCFLALVVLGTAQTTCEQTYFATCFRDAGATVFNADDDLITIFGTLNAILTLELDTQGRSCGYLNSVTDKPKFKSCIQELATACQALKGTIIGALGTQTDSKSYLMKVAITNLIDTTKSGETVDLFFASTCASECANNRDLFTTIDGCNGGAGLTTLTCSEWSCAGTAINQCELVKTLTAQGNPALTEAGCTGSSSGPAPATSTCSITELTNRLKCFWDFFVPVALIPNIFIQPPAEGLCTVMRNIKSRKADYLTCYTELMNTCLSNQMQQLNDLIDQLPADDGVKTVLKQMYANLISPNAVSVIIDLDTDLFCGTVCAGFVAPNAVDTLSSCVGVTSDLPFPKIVIDGFLKGSVSGACGVADELVKCFSMSLKDCPLFDQLFSLVFGVPPSTLTISAFIDECKQDTSLIPGCNLGKHVQCLANSFPNEFNMDPMKTTIVIMENANAFCSVKDNFNVPATIMCLREMAGECGNALGASDIAGLLGPMAPISETDPRIALSLVPDLVQIAFDDICTSECLSFLSGTIPDTTSCYTDSLQKLTEISTAKGDPIAQLCREVTALSTCYLGIFGGCNVIEKMVAKVSTELKFAMDLRDPFPDCANLITGAIGTCDIGKLTDCVRMTIPPGTFDLTDPTQLLSGVSTDKEAFCAVAGLWNVADLTKCYQDFFESCGSDAASAEMQAIFKPVAELPNGQTIQMGIDYVSRGIDIIFKQVCIADCEPLFTGQQAFDPSSCLLSTVFNGDAIANLVKLGFQDYSGVTSVCNEVLGCMRGATGQCTLLDDIGSLLSQGTAPQLSCNLIMDFITTLGLPSLPNIIPATSCDQVILKTCLNTVGTAAGLPPISTSGTWTPEELLNWRPQTDICKMDLGATKACFISYMNTCGLQKQIEASTQSLSGFEKALIEVLYDPTSAYWQRFECTICNAECANFDENFQELSTCVTGINVADLISSFFGVLFTDPTVAGLCTQVKTVLDCFKNKVAGCGALAPIAQKILADSGSLLLPSTLCLDASLLEPISGSSCTGAAALSAGDCTTADFAKCDVLKTVYEQALANINMLPTEKCTKVQDYVSCISDTAEEKCNDDITKEAMKSIFKVQIPEEFLKVTGNCYLNWQPTAEALTAGTTSPALAGGILMVCMALLAIVY